MRYHPLAIALHWVMALLIVVLLCLGLYMTSLPMSPGRLQFYNWHKWAGIIVLMLAAMRILTRLLKTPPPLPRMPQWQRLAAGATHVMFYVAFFAVPLAGWVYSSAAGFPVVLLGVVPLPDIARVDAGVAEQFKMIHRTAAWCLGVLVVAHIAAVLKHQLLDNDGLFSRMWLGSLGGNK